MQMLKGKDGIGIAADVWGEADRPAVLLQHGGGQTRHAWKGTGEKLAEGGFRAFALDARGHGDSEWAADGNYQQETMIDDIVAIAGAVSPEPPVLVGASMGGGVSLCAVGEEQMVARALVLVDMAPRIEPEGAKRIMDFMQQKPDGFDSLEQVADAIAAYQPHRKRPRVLDGLKKNVRLDENGRLRWHWDPNWLGGGRTGEIDARRARMQQAAERLAELGVPTLLVRGGLSDVLSPEGAESFLETVPHAEYVNVTDAAHMVAGDRNDLFTDAVVEFLNKI